MYMEKMNIEYKPELVRETLKQLGVSPQRFNAHYVKVVLSKSGFTKLKVTKEGKEYVCVADLGAKDDARPIRRPNERLRRGRGR